MTQYDLPGAAALFYLPNGADRKAFYSIFIAEYGDMTPIYQEPFRLAEHIRAVGASLKYSLDKLYETLSLEYNPIENYDRAESWTDSGTRNTQYTGGETRQLSGNGSVNYSGGSTNVTGARETEHLVSADNAGTYYPHEKDTSPAVTDTSTFNNRADSSSNSETETTTYSGRSDAESSGGTHTGRIHGNIGVTTSQQMIQSERDLVRYNFYYEAAEMYAAKLLVMIY